MKEANMDFSKLTAFLDTLALNYTVPGCACIVTNHHQVIYCHYTGYANAAHTRPVRENDIYYLFSATKVITCTAVMQLVEAGKISLEDAVDNYLPEFGNMRVLCEMPEQPVMAVPENMATRPSNKKIRIVDLLTMTSGLTYDIKTRPILELQKQSGGKATTREMVRAIAATPLLCDPAEHWIYSLSHDVLAAVIEVVSGRRFSEYLKEHIFEPIGIKDVYFNPPEEVQARFSELYMHAFGEDRIDAIELKNKFQLSDNYESGGAGLAMTAGEYAKFVETMSCGGRSRNGKIILKRETIDLMRRNYLNGVELNDFAKTGKTGYGYGLGVRTLIDKTASRGPVGEFGWDGAAGAYAMIDPENEIGIFYAEHIMGHMDSYYKIHPQIRDLTYEALGL